MTATIHSFEEAYERKHSTRDLLLPAFTQDYSEVELAEIEVDRIMENIQELLEERGAIREQP